MPKNKPLFPARVFFCAWLLSSAAFAESAEQAPYQVVQPGAGAPAGQGPVSTAPVGSKGISVWDDRVFNVTGGTTDNVGGPGSREIDRSKELNYNVEQMQRWKNNCASARDNNSKAFRDCVNAQKESELSKGTSFGVREPRSGSNGLNVPALPSRQSSPPNLQNLKPTQPEESENSAEE